MGMALKVRLERNLSPNITFLNILLYRHHGDGYTYVVQEYLTFTVYLIYPNRRLFSTIPGEPKKGDVKWR